MQETDRQTDESITKHQSLTILLIEDNPGDARYIKEMISGSNEFSIRSPSSPQAAMGTRSKRGAEPTVIHESRLDDGLARIQDGEIDIVLLDLKLPDSDGEETLLRLRDHDESLPVVVLTGLRDRELGLDTLRGGADEYLVKDEVNTDLLVRSIYHAIERKAHERELEQYQTLIETVNDGVYAVDDDSRFVLVNEALVSMAGYSREELLGSKASLLADQSVVDKAAEINQSMVNGAEKGGVMETEIQTADDRIIPVETNFSPFPLGDERYGRTGIIRDITERKERERELKRQRSRLATLNSLNDLVHDVSHLVIEASTREEIEQQVCEQLAAADRYEFAWIGDVGPTHETMRLRAEAGVEGYLEGFSIPVTNGDEGGPTAEAVRSGTVTVAQNIHQHPNDVEWRQRAETYGFRSSAAIPIEHEGTPYGILNLYSERSEAFDEDERAVIGRLGEVVGHAINAIERKEALMSEEVVEIRFQIRDVLESFGIETSGEGRISFERVVPVSGDVFLEYGTFTDDMEETFMELVETLPHFDSVSILDELNGISRFELRLTQPPVISTVAALGGQVESAVFEEGDFSLVIHVPHSVNVNTVVDTIQEEYPTAEVIAQRQTTQTQDTAERVESSILDQLTEKQRAAVESAYFAGFFEWPRDRSGEEIADSMDVSPPTFHQHLRTAERKLLQTLID